MRKITGKAVSLVLALALIVTSFSANFAFAATTSVNGTVSGTDEDTISLVNGESTTAERTVFDIQDWIKPVLDTKDHQDGIGLVGISAISHVSGNTLVKWTIDSNDGSADLILKSSDSKGTEVISILYTATYSNEDGDNVTVKASKQFTVNVYDADSAIIRVYDSGTTHGEVPDEVGAFARNDMSYKTIAVYKATKDASSPKAAWTTLMNPIINTASRQASSVNDAMLATLKEADGVTAPQNGDCFVYSDNKNVILTANADKTITAKVTSLGTGIAATSATETGAILSVTGNAAITAKLIKNSSVSTSSDDKAIAKTKIDKKVIAPSGFTNIDKDGGKTYLYAGSVYENANIEITDSEVVFGGADGIAQAAGTATVSDGTVKKVSGTVSDLEINGGTVSSVDLDGGNVAIDDAKVGNVTTDDGLAGYGEVSVTSGTVGNIDTTGAADGADTVSVTGGTVGTIVTDHDVTLTADDEDITVVTGAISASTIDMDSSDGKVSTGKITANNSGSTIKITGNGVNVSAIDFDYYNTNLILTDFDGKIPAALNAVNGTLSTALEDEDSSSATVTGAAGFDSINADDSTALSFDSTVKVGDLSGSGSVKVYAGKLSVSGSASGIVLKLADTTLTVGTVAFTADTDTVDVDDLDTFGFTVTKLSGASIDSFKIASINFAGIVIDPETADVAVGYSKTFTAVAYPTGTSVPAGSTVVWDFDGSNDVFSVTTTGNTATIKVLKTDPNFSSENTGTLTATLYDADGYELDDYSVATSTVTAIATPKAVSDTNAALSVAKGASYTMKVTSSTAPSVTAGTAGMFSVALVSKTGNDYFYKLTATGTVGAATGIYLNGNKIFVATVKAFPFTSDTTIDTTVKGAYQFKITSATTPTVGLGTAGVFKLAYVTKSGNDYFYKVTSSGAAGAKTGVYVNGAKAFVAVVG